MAKKEFPEGAALPQTRQVQGIPARQGVLAWHASSSAAGRVNFVFERADCVIVVAVRAARVIAGVVHFRAVPLGDPVNVAVVVEEAAPGKIAGAIQGLAEPQFGAARGTGRIAGARVGSTGVGRRFFGDRSEGPGAVVRKASRGQVGVGSRVATERKYVCFTFFRIRGRILRSRIHICC